MASALPLPGCEQHEVPCLHDRADALCDAVCGHLVDVVVEEAGVVFACLLGECFDARARRERRARFVESDMPVGSDAQDLHVDAARRLDCRVVLRAGVLDRVEVAVRHMHERRVEPERFDDGARDDAAVRLRVARVEAGVFVEREPAHMRHVEVPLLDLLREFGVGGERAGSRGEPEHAVGCACDEVRDAARVDGAGFLLGMDDDDFRHDGCSLDMLVYGEVWVTG